MRIVYYCTCLQKIRDSEDASFGSLQVCYLFHIVKKRIEKKMYNSVQTVKAKRENTNYLCMYMYGLLYLIELVNHLQTF